MKKILLVLAILFISQFQISIHPREVVARDRIGSAPFLRTYTHYADGMTYRIFVVWPDGSAMSVSNVTKDKLEIERLQLEINRLKNMR
jgi:hypothetical protein